MSYTQKLKAPIELTNHSITVAHISFIDKNTVIVIP